MKIEVELNPDTPREVLDYIIDLLVKCQPYVNGVTVSKGKTYQGDSSS